MGHPKALAQKLEPSTAPLAGGGERFRGYGVMGLPFASGHVLAFRRMAASSIGPPYTSVWHRNAEGRWTFYVDVDPLCACPRFFGRALDRVVESDIVLEWEGPSELSVSIPEARLQWGVRLSSDLLTRIYNTLSGSMPSGFWKSPGALSVLARVGGPVLGLGRIALCGEAPNGQRFLAAPRLLWRVEATAALVDGEELGPMAGLPEQASLGDFLLPNQGLFVFGEAWFEALDPAPQPQVIVGRGETRSPSSRFAGGPRATRIRPEERKRRIP